VTENNAAARTYDKIVVYVSMSVAVELTAAQTLGAYDDGTVGPITAEQVRESIRDSRNVYGFLGDWGIASWDDADVTVVCGGNGERIDVCELIGGAS